MAKQLNVNMSFTADTSQAKRQMQDLQNSLTKLTSTSKINLGVEEEIQNAIKATAELSVHLRQAINTDTGTLDFSKLNQSIKASGKTLQDYGQYLKQLGPEGQQAFMKLAQSVVQAEMPLRRTNALIKEFATTLANTARWQLSSSVLHGFMGALQSAYGYAQDLNESLNNIRIVTGKNVEEMANFAKEANAAAKALSTTTTAYTNASLIYYQQGLSADEVKKRADVTIKLANVSRQSAEIASEQLTAIWNNFYDGSKSLEHYADVMTALGAATASSTEEIAGGLEKFAAVADTIGLSYEYAAAALATITSNTRESEQVVGTALKTIFARIQGLNLGETLEDGTTLNKYSEALYKVGINIKDANGNLKDMDNILSELGAKWETLRKDQQVALAQTVAGTRQYNQLIALMNNWAGDSDSFMSNLATAQGSDGALQEQADIYAESWEAASQRVKAAAETIYDNLINDEFFIDLLNNIEKILNFVNKLIDTLGGLKGTLLMVGGIVTRVFSDQIAKGLTNMAYNAKMFFNPKKAKAEMEKEKQSFIDDAISKIPQSKDFVTTTESAQQNSMRSQLELQQEMLTYAERMSIEEQTRNQMLLDRNRLMQEETVLAAQAKEQSSAEVDSAKFTLQARIYATEKDADIARAAIKNLNDEIVKIRASSNAVATASEALNQFKATTDRSKKTIAELRNAIVNIDTDDDDIKELIKEFKLIDLNADNAEQEIGELISRLKALNAESVKNIKTNFISPTMSAEEVRKVTAEIDRLTVAVGEDEAAQQKLTHAQRESKKANDLARESIQNSTGAQKSWADMLVASANVAMMTASAFSTLGSAWETIRDPDVSGWEKFTTILMALGSLSLTLVTLWNSLKTLINLDTVAKIANVAATIAQTAAEKGYKKARDKSTDSMKKGTRQTWKDTWNKIKDTWNKKSYEAQGGTIHKNGTSSLKGRKGTVSAAETSQLSSEAGKTALKNLGTKVGGAVIIAASVAAAAAIVKTAIDHYNRFDAAAEKAKETAKALKSTYETVAAAENEFRNTISSYDSAVEGLDKLVKGTEEYKEAVRQANNAAVELLNTHKNLKYEINDDGLIEIDEGSLAAAQRESLEKQARANAAAVSAQQDAENAQLEADKIKFQRTQMRAGGAHWDEDDTTAVAGGVGAGAALAGGAVAYTAIAASNVWNPVGWAMLIAGAVAAVIGVGIATFNNDADNREAQTLTALEEFSTNAGGRDLTKEEIKKIADEQDATGQLADSLLDDIDATNEMIAEMRANTEAINRNNELIAHQILQTNDYVANSEYFSEVNTRSGLVYGQAYKEALANVENSGWGKDGISKATGVNDEAKSVWEDYIKYAGLEDKGWQLVDTTGTDKKRIFVYLDEQGQRQEKTLSEMQKMKAAYMASVVMNENANKLVGYFAEWTKKEDAADQAITAFLLNQNFEDATKKETDAVKNDVETNYNGDYKAYLTAKHGDLDAAAEMLGYSSADAYVAAFEGSINNIDWTAIDFFDKLPAEIASNMSMTTAKHLDHLVKMMNASRLGEAAGQEFTTGLTNLLSNVKPADQEAILEKIANIDWTQWDAGWQIVDIMKAFGYEVNLSDGAFEKWVDQMNIANGAAFDHAQALKDIAKMQNMVEDFTLGEVVSQEDYDMLVKYNAELAKFFRLMGDGTYKLTGDPLDLIQNIEDGIYEAYRDTLAGAQANYDKGLERQAVDNAVSATDYDRGQLTADLWDQTGTNKVLTGYNIDFGDNLEAIGATLLDLDFWAGVAENTMYGPGSSSYVGHNGYEFADEDDAEYRYDPIYGVVNTDQYKAQLDFITKQIPDYADEVAQWRKDLDAGKTTAEDTAEVAKIIKEYLEKYPELAKDEITGLSTELEELEQKRLSAEIDYAKTASSLEALAQMYNEKKIGDEAYNTAQMDFVMTEKWGNMDPNEVNEYANALLDAAKNSELLDDNMSQEAAEDVALYVKKMNQGVQKLQDGFEKWNLILQKSDKSSEEYIESMSGMKDAMSDILGVSEDFINNDFILNHLADIEKAANGDASAIDSLAKALGRQIILDITINESSMQDAALDAHDDLQELLDDKKVGFSVNVDMDPTGIIDGAQKVVNSAKMTVAEAQAYFNSLGYEPVFKTETKDIEQRVPVTVTKSQIIEQSEDGKEWTTRTSSYQDGYDTYTGQMDVVAMSSDGTTPQIESLTKKSSGAMNNSSSSNPGISNNSKKIKPTKKTDIVDRYKEVNDSLSVVADTADDAAQAMDRLYGTKRITQMKTVNDLLKNEIKLLDDKKGQIESNLAIDQTAVGSALSNVYNKLGTASTARTAFTYDDNGNITNYTSIMTSFFNQLSSIESAAMADGIITEAEEERIDALKEVIEELKAAIDQYDSTKTELADIDNQLTDKFYEWQDNNQEMLTYKLELNLEINDLELQEIEYYLNKIGSDFYSMAEAAKYLIGTATGSTLNTSNSKLANLLGNTADYNALYTDTVTSYNSYVKTNDNGEVVSATEDEYKAGLAQRSISDAAYAENLKTVYNGLVENLGALNELDSTMLAYYGETVAAASEELDKHTARMEHHSTVLEHYNKLLGLIGEENNFKAIGIVLEGQATTAENNLKVSTEMFKTFNEEAQHWQRKMTAALAEGDTAAFDLYQENWEAAEAQARESQDKMLSDLAAWAEAEKAVLENTLSDLGKTLEESLTGGLSFDKLSMQMERAQSLQEEYLTTTNQIYETTKMMRTAQQAIDASSNTVAKEKLKNFITETKSLQEQGKLSQYELDMQQAKYDLLVAEIALEEAQNAKSTVRLQRDSEGNFGYVYTADAGAVSEAQQQFDDAQNALYNKGLEGANDYAQKYNTTMQEMYDTFNQIQEDRLNGAFATEEEYNNAMAEAKAYYYQKLQDYSNLYGVSVSADSNIAAEAWSTDFASMINATDQWKQDVDAYMLGANEAFTKWAEVVATVKETTGKDLTDLASNVSSITQANTKMVEQLTDSENGVIKKMQDELKEVGNLTAAYGEYRQSVLNTISTLEQLMKTTASSITTLTIATNTTTSDGTVGAATGGLTSSWGPEGKVMMVHENELILNSDQTNRFFDNLALMESILATIDSYALNQQLGGTLSSPTHIENGSDVLEQNVKIEASFPGVTDRTEIEEAFNNLVNKASQYANRK